MKADVARIEAGPIFEKYFAGISPFSHTADKKFEFPDAFVLEALGQWAEDREISSSSFPAMNCSGKEARNSLV
jgi:hypothetical protein